MEQNAEYPLYSGDLFSLFLKSYWYELKVKLCTPNEGINYAFYSNKIPSSPEGDLVDNIHALWADQLDRLERHHGYIQWLFPLFVDNGMNSRAHKLKKEEALYIREDLEASKRVILSYRLMLHFYGIVLVDEHTGEVAGHQDKEFRTQRYDNLNWNSHNNLRISRILISLGHLGFRRYKKPLVDHFAVEIRKHGLMPRCKSSLEEYWLRLLDVDTVWYKKMTLENEEDREESIFFRVSG